MINQRSTSFFVAIIVMVAIWLSTSSCGSLNSQEEAYRYDSAMTANIQLLEEAQTIDAYINLALSFKELSSSNDEDWLPLYYEAFSIYMTGWAFDVLDKDEVAIESLAVLDDADKLSPDNAEIYCLRYMILGMQMLVDVSNRWSTYGVDANTCLAKAEHLDPMNPRIYYLRGTGFLYTPDQYGGGTDKAVDQLYKSVALYEKYLPKSSLHPNWGRTQAEETLLLLEDGLVEEDVQEVGEGEE